MCARNEFKLMVKDVLDELLKENLRIDVNESYVQSYSDEKELKVDVVWDGESIND